MKIKKLHKWDVTPKEAVQIQRKLTIKKYPLRKKVRLVAGADVAFPKGPGKGERMVRAAVCVLTFPALEMVEKQTAHVIKTFPYVPGLLSFREGPALVECFKKVRNRPDVVIFDGHGMAHPRGVGIAVHMGIILEIPSIGCAKSPLYGKSEIPGITKGNYTFVRDKGGDVIGACLRTRDGIKPVYISVGNKINLMDSVNIALECSTRFRLPEPVRLADKLSKEDG